MRADRLLSLLLLLQARGQATAKDLASQLEVSVRTIYRDLQALSAAGVPVYAEAGPGGGCRLLEGYRNPLTGLSPDEATALLTLGVPQPISDLGLDGLFASAHLKLLASVPETRRSPRFLLDAPAFFRPPEAMPYLPGVAEAVRHERRIKITYERTRGRMVTRSVDPLGLVNKAGWWYLVGHANKNISVFRVSRLHKVDQLDDPFRYPKDFDLASFWSDWTEDFERTRTKVQVLVRVSPNLAHALPEIFGELVRSLLDTAESDEQGWKKLRLSFESLKAAQYRLMGLGTEAEILEPLELRSAVAESAKRIAEFYAVRSFPKS